MKHFASPLRRLLGALLVLTWLGLAAAPAALAQNGPPAGAPPDKPTSFGSDAAPAAGAPQTPADELAQCQRLVVQLGEDTDHWPFLAAAYIAFFAIPVVFLVLAAVRQRRLEGEMAELRERLARLQGDAGAT